MSAGANAWARQEHVLAGPFADLLRRACAEEREFAAGQRFLNPHFDHGKAAMWTGTSRQFWERRYAERYAVSDRTATRHFNLVLHQPTVPVVIADRVAALCGVPFAYLEAICLSA